MRERSRRPTSEIESDDRTRADRFETYRRGEYPAHRLFLEATCPDCHAQAPPYRHVLEHEPCGCIRPFEAFSDAGGCPNCGGVEGATVIARLYACQTCGSSFDTPEYHLDAREAPDTPSESATAFEWGPPLECREPAEAANAGGPAEEPALGDPAEESAADDPESVSSTAGRPVSAAGGGGDR